nr:hypothetical protein [uncultured Halomonas sp.]
MSSNEIFEIVNGQYNIGDPNNPRSLVYKVIHGIYNSLSFDDTNFEMPIINTRARGYRLNINAGWESVSKPIEQKILEDQKNIMRKIMHDCMAHVERSRVRTINGHVQVIDVAPDVAERNFSLLNDALQQISKTLLSERNLPQVRDIKSFMMEFLTYAAFWRMGDNLTDNQWKNDYYREIQNVVRRVENAIDQAINENSFMASK